jgi:hypothetical protein
MRFFGWAAFLTVATAAAGCGGDTCKLTARCSVALPGGKPDGTYSSCRGPDGCYLLMSDGTRFPCASCSDCRTASDHADEWCLGPPPANPDYCLGYSNCDNSILYQGPCSADAKVCHYQTDQGLIFPCDSCDDCRAALQAVTTFVCGLTEPVAACNVGASTTKDSCNQCCTTEYANVPPALLLACQRGCPAN